MLCFGKVLFGVVTSCDVVEIDIYQLAGKLVSWGLVWARGGCQAWYVAVSGQLMMLVGGRQEAVPVEECRLLVARVEHMQRQVAMGVCDEAMRTFPSRTLHCPAIENAGTSTLPARQLSRARGTKKAKTHGRSVFRRQSKIHFRGTIAPQRQLTCAHRLPASATPA